MSAFWCHTYSNESD